MKKFRKILIIISVSIMLVSCGNSDAKKAYESGKEALSKSNYAQASDSLNLALEEGYNDKNNEIKDLLDAIDNYNIARDLYNSDDLAKLDNALQLLREVENTTSKRLKEDAIDLKFNIENKKEQIISSKNEKKEKAKSAGFTRKYKTKEEPKEEVKEEKIDLIGADISNTNSRPLTISEAKERLFRETYCDPEYSKIVHEVEGDVSKDGDEWYFLEVYSLSNDTEPELWYFVNSETGEISEEGVSHP